MDGLRARLGALAWSAGALAIALGAAGLVAAMEASPVAGARPELTAVGDAEVVPALDAIETDLRGLSAEVDGLGTQARGALAALGANRFDTVEAAMRRGDRILRGIGDRARAIGEAVTAVPRVGLPVARYTVSSAVMDRYHRLGAATDAVAGLDLAWADLTSGSLAASRLSALLEAHDAAVLRAAERGRGADYPAALEILDGADAAIAEARRLRTVLASTVDVEVLDQWLDRNERYDRALRALYAALDGAGSRVTPEVRAAIAAEREAKDGLPGDARALIVIMGEIGRGGMNSAVIAIEEARGRLDAAIDAADDPTATGSSPSATPAP